MSKSKILSVNYVDLQIIKDIPSKLKVKVNGYVVSSGWKSPELMENDEDEEEGIYTFNFIAEEPTGACTPVLKEVNLEYEFIKPENFKSIRIISQENYLMVGIKEKSLDIKSLLGVVVILFIIFLFWLFI